MEKEMNTVKCRKNENNIMKKKLRELKEAIVKKIILLSSI